MLYHLHAQDVKNRSNQVGHRGQQHLNIEYRRYACEIKAICHANFSAYVPMYVLVYLATCVQETERESIMKNCIA